MNTETRFHGPSPQACSYGPFAASSSRRPITARSDREYYQQSYMAHRTYGTFQIRRAAGEEICNDARDAADRGDGLYGDKRTIPWQSRRAKSRKIFAAKLIPMRERTASWRLVCAGNAPRSELRGHARG